jgi:hypothetical protein
MTNPLIVLIGLMVISLLLSTRLKESPMMSKEQDQNPEIARVA